eukprot:15331026-Ditylum_brightwellii.AAC.1
MIDYPVIPGANIVAVIKTAAVSFSGHPNHAVSHEASIFKMGKEKYQLGGRSQNYSHDANAYPK